MDIIRYFCAALKMLLFNIYYYFLGKQCFIHNLIKTLIT